MSSVTVPEFLSRSQKYTDTYTPAWKFADATEKTIRTHVLIITCLDPRLEPEQMFDLHKGEASVIRNVAGRAKMALVDVITITELAPITDIMVVHHSDCGATHFTEKSMKKQVKTRVSGHDEELEAMYFGEIVGGDVEESVREDVEFLRTSPFVKKELKIHGYVIDIISGKLETVVE